jgi:undecaprenyl diphosphate synthase
MSQQQNLKTFTKLPRHVAIIMDGNNRWAKAHKLPGLAGHKAGVDAVRETVNSCARYGVEALTLFAFSSENWRRPEDEVKGLMELFMLALKREVKKLHSNNIRLRVIGDRSRFSQRLQKNITDAEALTASNGGMTLSIAANYGGQWDIAEAAKLLASAVQDGQLKVEDISAERLASHLSLADLPVPDLCIRTGGEERISNFLLWQLAYAELYFTPVFWPDFGQSGLEDAFTDFSNRQRRFGKTGDQLEDEQRNA